MDVRTLLKVSCPTETQGLCTIDYLHSVLVSILPRFYSSDWLRRNGVYPLSEAFNCRIICIADDTDF